MKLSKMEHLIKKVRKEKGDCELQDILMNDKGVNIIFEDKNGELVMYAKDYNDIDGNGFFGKRDNSKVCWGECSDEEMKSKNSGGHW